MNSYKGSREAFAAALCDLAQNDNRIMFVSADSLKAMRATSFAEKYPAQYIEAGIAEQNAVNTAAGLASCGLIPFVGTYAGFITMRACEQVRTFVAYPEMNVKFIGINGGLLGGEREGVTHQALEDVSIMRAIPGMTVITPADQYQVYKAVMAAAAIDGPVYIRCASGREPVVFNETTPFETGKNKIIKEYGHDVAIFSSGFVLDRAIQAVDNLKSRGVNATLVDVSTIKPLDADGTQEVIRKCNCAVTVEDHTIIGGLGSAIAELVTETYPIPIARVGLKDVFPESGEAAALLDKYHIGVPDIVSASMEVITKK